MNPDPVIGRLKNEKFLAILRLKDGKGVSPMVDKCVNAGIKALEITSNTPGFGREIRAARKNHPDILIGAGTIVNTDLARAAIDAGAQFFVTPNVNPLVIREANKNGIPIMVGTMTPTEIFTAMDMGADAIKLFPAQSLGIAHYKAIKAVLGDVYVFAVGGIDFENAKDWIAAGVAGVGLGSSMTEYIKTTDPEWARERIARFRRDLEEE